MRLAIDIIQTNTFPLRKTLETGSLPTGQGSGTESRIASGTNQMTIHFCMKKVFPNQSSFYLLVGEMTIHTATGIMKMELQKIVTILEASVVQGTTSKISNMKMPEEQMATLSDQ
jgi:hypothetical protein